MMKISSSSSMYPMSPISPGWFLGSVTEVSVSKNLSRAFRTTQLHDPDLVGKGNLAKLRHMESTGPASVIPYPCPSFAVGIIA
ncbi:hypothetical protein ZOSMA_524G00020 [Zostera marina]|uniref:Uncharacterized protein n=1 Tax=Zostera marina TaxID=29655 RepID=A0A0K9NZW8_ZOSMR|nr:hypothetical protein ZOSMA_524G00020 [Zostera marina]